MNFRPSAARRPLLTLSLLLLTAHCSPLTAQASWTRQRTGTLAWLHGVYFADESRGWAVGSKGALLATEDGGATWRLQQPPSEDALRDIFFADARNGWIVCERSIYLLREKDEQRSYLLRTADGGRTWSRVEPAGADVDARLVGVRFADAAHGWTFGEMGAIYATSDGGATWARRRLPTRHLILGAEFLDARRGWIVGAGATILRTEDGGATWREGRLVPGAGGGRLADMPPAVRPRTAAPARDVTDGAGTGAAGSARVDGHAPRLYAVDFADERRGWAVGSRGAISATEDGGRTWTAQSSGVEADLYDVKFHDAREGWAVGGDGAVLRTTDGGRTWRAETPATRHTLERLFFAARGRGWAVGFGGTVISFKA